MEKPTQRNIRGIEERAELNPTEMHRDTRPLPLQLLDPIKSGPVQSIIIMAAAVFGFGMPAMVWPCFLISTLFFLVRVVASRKERLPWRLPQSLGAVTDHGDPKPGRRGYFKARGAYFLGNAFGMARELWVTLSDILEHMLILGGTGAGKTEALLSINFNALVTGSGLSYVDPKAAPKLGFQIYQMARMLGRDDDFLMLNFGTGGQDVVEGSERLSNTTNPFAFGSSDTLTQLLVSLMPVEQGQNSIFASNAQTLIIGLLKGLVELRDAGKVELSIEVIGEHMTPHKYVELAERDDLSPIGKRAVQASLQTVGWKPGVPMDMQTEAFYDQFQYASSYFGLTMASFTYTYPHIYGNGTRLGEIDLYDLIVNRRILVTMLPSMEKAPAELLNLGKIILSGMKNACAVGLGSKVEGTVEDVVNSLPVNSRSPFLLTVDEYAAIVTPGFPIILTQGRGLGIAAIVSSQDFKGIAEEDKKGAGQIVGNTEIKWAMKTNDPFETWELWQKVASESTVMMSSGLQVHGEFGGYQDQTTTTAHRKARIELQDLQEQIWGEFHGFFKGRIVRGSAFYAEPPLPPHAQLRIAQFLEVQPVDETAAAAEADPFYMDDFLDEEWGRMVEAEKQKLAAGVEDKIPEAAAKGSFSFIDEEWERLKEEKQKQT